MTSASNIGWGEYGGFEGPYYTGSVRYTPMSDRFWEKCVHVVTATEGGRYDAVNMYDVCVVSVGILQVCEKVLEMSRMLASMEKVAPAELSAALQAMPSPLTMVTDQSGRRVLADGSGPINTVARMQQVYLGCTGERGKWTSALKDSAKAWAAGFANLCATPALIAPQLEYVEERLPAYVMKAARDELFRKAWDEGWEGAMKAMYVSYAANLPAVADSRARAAFSDPRWSGSSPADKFLILADSMVKSGVAIWPHRFDKISPVLSQRFGVQCPSSSELGAPAAGLSSPMEIQAALVKLGYDLGPAGADGVIGRKTTEAVKAFQAKSGLSADGVVGPKTRAALQSALDGSS